MLWLRGQDPDPEAGPATLAVRSLVPLGAFSAQGDSQQEVVRTRMERRLTVTVALTPGQPCQQQPRLRRPQLRQSRPQPQMPPGPIGFQFRPAGFQFRPAGPPPATPVGRTEPLAEPYNVTVGLVQRLQLRSLDRSELLDLAAHLIAVIRLLTRSTTPTFHD